MILKTKQKGICTCRKTAYANPLLNIIYHLCEVKLIIELSVKLSATALTKLAVHGIIRVASRTAL